MKKLMSLVLAGVLVFSVPLMAQNSPAGHSQLSRKERRLARKAEKKKEIDQLYQLAESKSFVIDANYLYDRYNRQYMAANHNFVAVEGDKIVLQTASPYGVGYNGIGGVTVVGKIQKYDIKKDRKGESIFIKAQITTNFASSGTVFIRIAGRERASAQVYGPWGKDISFAGNIESPEQRFRYQGQTLPMF